MDEPTTVSSSGRPGAGPQSEGGSSLGTIHSFVEMTELRRLLGQLTASELVRMMVSETWG